MEFQPKVLRLNETPTQAQIFEVTGWRTQLQFGEVLALIHWGEDGIGWETEYVRKQFIEEQCNENLHEFQEWYANEVINVLYETYPHQ